MQQVNTNHFMQKFYL